MPDPFDAVLDARSEARTEQLARGERRYRRRVASPKQWQAIRAAKCEGRCRICEREQYPVLRPTVTLESHHLIPRDRHGDDLADNIVGLCADCHRGVELREPAHCRLMLTRLSDAEYAYAVGKLGEGGLERLYGVEYERQS
jgi:5-methylcytosine-specific restriction endonuclease McrA